MDPELAKLISLRSFNKGIMEGIRMYAIWRNGEQLVGCLEKPLKEVLAPYEEEIAKIEQQIETRKKLA